MSLDKSGGFAPTCTVVICTRNRPEQLERCLATVGCLEYPRFDVLVVDNAPSDEAASDIAARSGAHYIIEPTVGLSRARNRGARACKSEIVAYLDDDALPDRGWLTGLAREFEDPKVMAVTGRTFALKLGPEAERLCALFGSGETGGPQWRKVDRQTPSWFELANFGGIGDGNMAFRRCAFDLWPGFEERLGRGVTLDGGEEHHAFFSLIDRGHSVVYTPHAVMHHPCPQTMRDLRARHLRDLAASTGYITLLFVEEPRYRRRLIKYVVEALQGTRRTWRHPVGASSLRIVPRWRMVLAYLYGSLLYLRSRLVRTPSVSLIRRESALDELHIQSLEKPLTQRSPLRSDRPRSDTP